MDIDFGELDAINANVKATKKFKPKPKAPSKPKPKTNTQPPPPPVEVSATTDNEKILEEQPADVSQVSGNMNDDWQSSFEKPQEENDEGYLTLESLNDFLPQSTPVTTEKESIEEPDLESFPQIDPLTGEEASIFNDNQDFHLQNLSSVSKDDESSLFWESTTSAGQKIEKMKPKPNAQNRKVENTLPDPCEIEYVDDTSGPTFTPERFLGSPSIGITDSIPTETVSDFHVTEEPPTFTDFSTIPSDHLDSIPDSPSTVNETMNKGTTQSCDGNQGSRSSERLRRQSKKSFVLRDEFEYEGIDNDNNNNNNNDNIDDYRPENEKKGRKSTKPVNENKKPVRKRKKATEVTTEPTKAPKKKFPHSTRRNKRQVDPELLKMPEDQLELNMHNIPMKELIRLAEHKERLAKKDASTSGTPALNHQSGGGYSNPYDDEEGFGEGNGNGESVEADNTYYNYRTYMKTSQRMKWSKQDTELFYEAVQQFGTDLSMIKECFPGRTREQIKSKYKKEERQHPLRLNDALTTPFKGDAHFKVVIQRLKEAQGQDSENEDPDNLEGEENEDAVTNDINEVTKGVGEKEKEGKEMEGDVGNKVGSPTKSHDSDDEMYRWSQYKSEI